MSSSSLQVLAARLRAGGSVTAMVVGCMEGST